MTTQATARRWGSWLDDYHAACGWRPVLTAAELESAFAGGCGPAEVAARNDALADEYDAVLEAEEAEWHDTAW